MNEVFNQLSKLHPSIKYQSIEAEAVPEVSEKFEVNSVPYFVFVKGGKVIETLTGANAPELTKKCAQYSQQSSINNTVPKPQPTTPTVEQKKDLKQRLTELTNFAPIMVFIKGVPEAPRCGFSSKIVEILKEENVKYNSFDILSDEEVRQGLKEFSNWPTFPQLYVKGKLIGGLDIVKELHENGELKEILQETQEKKEDLNTRLKKLVESSPVMLFMKGTPDAPRCGFSSKLVALLREEGVTDFGHFDILSDEEVRQGLKTLSNWPTYPQLYAQGKFIGGLDIAKEMHDAGELHQLISTR